MSLQLIKLKRGAYETYLLNRYPNEIKNDTLKYFHKGWKSTKTGFKIVEGVNMPDVWDEAVTWLDVAKFYDQYGLEVANQYAENKTAGIVSKQTAIGYGKIYSKIKHLVDDTFDAGFFELLRCDYMLSCFGVYLFDIVALDAAFEKLETLIPDYRFKDGSHGRFDWIEPKEHGAKAWRLNESDPWNSDFTQMPALKVYNATECTYQGKPASMREYVMQRFGQKYVDVIDALNENL